MCLKSLACREVTHLMQQSRIQSQTVKRRAIFVYELKDRYRSWTCARKSNSKL
jgi:hypothetical protein